jgi:7,8-dihydropterin-6-yl-methyl-4-(beta-D-ribofuranosyl)aminobenzene 5'-phosphate synthase
MKLTVLADNITLIDHYLNGEPCLSSLIETEGNKILFDTGYSDVFFRNAQKMGTSLFDLDYIMLSHGHLDHTWGLVH